MIRMLPLWLILKSIVTAVFIILFTLGGCDRSDCVCSEEDVPKVICDTLLPEGVIISSHWTFSELHIKIANNSSVSSHALDEDLRFAYQKGDTIKHCQPEF